MTDSVKMDAIIRDRNQPQKHVARAQVLIATAEGFGTNEIMRRSGLSKPAVWRWQDWLWAKGSEASCATRPASRASRPCFPRRSCRWSSLRWPSYGVATREERCKRAFGHFAAPRIRLAAWTMFMRAGRTSSHLRVLRPQSGLTHI